MEVLAYERDGYISVYDNTDGLGFLKLFRERDANWFYVEIVLGEPGYSDLLRAREGKQASADRRA